MSFLKAIYNGEIKQKNLNKGNFSLDLFSKNPIPCLRCIDYSIIDQKGDVYACCYYSHLVKPIGNIMKNKFKDIWFSKGYNELRKKVTPVNMSYPEIKTTCEACDNYFEFKEIDKKINKNGI